MSCAAKGSHPLAGRDRSVSSVAQSHLLPQQFHAETGDHPPEYAGEATPTPKLTRYRQGRWKLWNPIRLHNWKSRVQAQDGEDFDVVQRIVREFDGIITWTLEI